MKTPARWFAAVVAAQVVFLLAWAGWHEHVRSHLPVVRLKVRPVDPRDLLRGDYMILGYEIGAVAVPPSVKRGAELWVVLESRDGFFAAVTATETRPALQPGRILVLGREASRGVRYGIEEFFVPEGKGTPSFKTIEVEAAVSATHRLAIKRVLLDGRPYPK
jgi:uncharacterized membrane-anchored protein